MAGGVRLLILKKNKCWSHTAPFSRLYLVKLKVVVQLIVVTTINKPNIAITIPCYLIPHK